MHVLGASVIWSFGFCMTIGLPKSEKYVMKPSGPNICARECRQTVGCQSYIFRTSDLSCLASAAISVQQRFHLRRSIQDKDQMNPQSNCRKGVRIFHSKRNKPVCRYQRGSRQPRQSDTNRILFFPGYNKKNVNLNTRQLYLHNNSVLVYPYIKRTVMAVGYISNLKTLIIASAFPNIIMSVPLDSQKGTIIQRNMHVKAMAVDEKKQIIFILTSRSNKRVYALTTKGENITAQFGFISKYSNCIIDIVADSRRHMLFVLYAHMEIAQLTHQGKEVFKERNGAISMFLDKEKDILYFLRKNPLAIYKMTLNDNISSREMQIEKSGKLFVSGFQFFVTSLGGVSKIYVFSVNNTMKTIDTGYYANAFHVRLCKVP